MSKYLYGGIYVLSWHKVSVVVHILSSRDCVLLNFTVQGSPTPGYPIDFVYNLPPECNLFLDHPQPIVKVDAVDFEVRDKVIVQGEIPVKALYVFVDPPPDIDVDEMLGE